MNETPEPTELIYAPRSSWSPAILAGGLAGLVAGLFTWWPYAAIGGAFAVVALIAFLRAGWRDLVKLPRSQPVATSPLPLTRRTRKASDPA
jgi:hypothetical protein